MSARVTLEMIRGPLQGRTFIFEERTVCVVGRAKDCKVYIPTPRAQRTISRHHCVLDINPPSIRIRDLGSLNGTLVNGKKIGQRAPHEDPQEVDLVGFREFDLQDGDRVRLGSTAFRVTILASTVREDVMPGPLVPRQTQVEAPEADPAVVPPPIAHAAIPATEPGVTQGPVCVQCGRDVSREAHAAGRGNYVCDVCRADPQELIRQLLAEARTGDKDLVAVRGYKLVREIGRGGMGAVYLARQEATEREIALKLMLPKVAATPKATDAFLREMQNTKALEHPHVVRLYESGCSRGVFFFTMEYCDGASVDKLLRQRGGKLPIADAVPVILQALEGLAYVHTAVIPYVRLKDGNVVQGRGLVHRDVKPANLFLCGSGSERVVKVGDYGLSKAFDMAGLSGHTCTGSIGGTFDYMPKQQLLNYRDAGPEVDVWAVAATLYRMLTGHVPRDFKEKQDPWRTVLQTEPIPIRQRDSSVPKKLAEVIDHALRDHPQIGFRTAAELKRALEQVG